MRALKTPGVSAPFCLAWPAGAGAGAALGGVGGGDSSVEDPADDGGEAQASDGVWLPEDAAEECGEDNGGEGKW